MRHEQRRLLAILFATTALNLLCLFESALPSNVFGLDLSANRIHQGVKACLTAALSTVEKSSDDKGESTLKLGDGHVSLSSNNVRSTYQLKLQSKQLAFMREPAAARKLWLLNRSLLI